jgi:hypothetical protein
MLSRIHGAIMTGTALALYLSGFCVGLAGACAVLVLGALAIFKGTPLVNNILIAAAISAIGLTIAETGRKILRTIPPAKHRYASHVAAKSIG